MQQLLNKHFMFVFLACAKNELSCNFQKTKHQIAVTQRKAFLLVLKIEPQVFCFKLAVAFAFTSYCLPTLAHSCALDVNK